MLGVGQMNVLESQEHMDIGQLAHFDFGTYVKKVIALS